MAATPDAIVVGAGPNGLSAAIALAQAGRSVAVYEARDRIGGGASSAEDTLPGFVHDTCSAVHPLALASPFWRTLPLAAHGLAWIEPPVQVAHPLDDGPAVLVWRSIDATARGLAADAARYSRVLGSATKVWTGVANLVEHPFRAALHPLALARFGMAALTPATSLARRRFREVRGRALLAGAAAHAMVPLDRFPASAAGLSLLTLAHTHGWVFPRGGAQSLAEALASLLRSLGGTIVTGAPVRNVDDLPPARAILCDLSPGPLLQVAGHRFDERFRRRLRAYRYGEAAFKVDWALAEPIPWRDPSVAQAGTVHLGGTLEEIAAAERQVWDGGIADRPFVLLAQPTLFDPTRAPAGRHTAWAYCHVPHRSTANALPLIEAQIERFAPGFRERVLHRRLTTPADFEHRNPNYVGGDIAMGRPDWRQLPVRPTRRLYRTSAPEILICSAATPPGIGVHGMCGYFAARAALRGPLA